MRGDRAKDLRHGKVITFLASGFGLFALALTLLPQAALADDVDRVRELRSTASILPLSQILSRVEKTYPGTLLEVELEEEDGRVIYEMELLGEDKVIRGLKVDAKSGDILSTEREN